MSRYKRIFIIVIDSLGVGALPDAAAYGDAGTDTLGHIAENTDPFRIPNLQKLGMAFPERGGPGGEAARLFCETE